MFVRETEELKAISPPRHLHELVIRLERQKFRDPAKLLSPIN